MPTDTLRLRRSTYTRALLLVAMLAATALAEDASPPTVGPLPDGSTLLPNGQIIRPVGKTFAYPGRPLDVCLTPDGASLLVKSNNALARFDAADLSLRQSLPLPAGEFGSMHGLVCFNDDKNGMQVLVTCARHTLLRASVDADQKLAWTGHIDIPGPLEGSSQPCGIAVSPDRSTAWVCLTINNALAVVDLRQNKLVAQIPVGVCPYDVAVSADGSKAWVTNFGGARPVAGQKIGASAGTDVAVDEHAFAIAGTVSVVDLPARREVEQIPVGLHPAQIILSRDGSRAYVANANSESISIIDVGQGRVIQTISTAPQPNSLFGSLTNALALGADGKTLFAANAGDNAIAVIDLENAAGPAIRGFVPTGWFPGALVASGKALYVVNVKGDGSRDFDRLHHGWNSLRVHGSVSRIEFPDEATLLRGAQQVRAAHAVVSIPATKPQYPEVPVPALGRRSCIRHVIYVIKENRTYDQVFGDLPKGNADPRLCIYGREVTPNAHAIAEQFVLLDNYYCNGVRSADGHQWATQGIVTDYQEKDLSGSVRSYDFGTDALCFAPTPFIWDAVLLSGQSFRNYGEFCWPTFRDKNFRWFDLHEKWKKGEHVAIVNEPSLPAVAAHSCRDYPGWNLAIPDVYRVQFFLDELKQFEKDGHFPNLCIVYLPQDHTHGLSPDTPTPRAMVADNDLALGKLVEAMSHSRFWSDCCIFVNEDDPQNGFDHVDGHRSICLVASPYARHGAVVSRFYNQTSVLHTIARMLGVRPMNQMVVLAPTMEDCFTLEPNPAPYEARPNLIALDETNKPPQARSSAQSELLDQIPRMRWSRPDLNDDDAFNRLLWLASAPDRAYPADMAGGHGRGLKPLGLALESKSRAASEPKDDD